MANWEYKVISSGKGGFASPALMEKFINDLGQDQWEIINFHTAPDNPLAFTGLARRTTLRDWTLEDAVATAARAETEKLRVEFEAKFKAATTGAAPEEKEPTFAEEKISPDDGYRRPVDTSRDDDPDAPEDDWQKLDKEDELPSFFDALKPHMRRNQRGPGMSVGLDFLAKKWKLEESDIKSALVECGMQIPGDENAKPVFVEYDGDVFWVNINRRGEIWINTREKPEPVFKIVAGKRLADEETAGLETSAATAAREQANPDGDQESFSPERPQFQPREPRHEQPQRNDERREHRDHENRPQTQGGAPRPVEQVFAPKTLLAKIRGMMRRNRRGHGWSGSFSFLTKALKMDQAQLLTAIAEFGLKVGNGKEQIIAEENGFAYWLNQNSNGEIWINAEEKRKERGATPAPAPVAAGADAQDSPAETTTAVESVPAGSAAPVNPVEEVSASESNRVMTRVLPAENTLTSVRLLMEPKKRGEGHTVSVSELAERLEKTDEQVLAVLNSAGLLLPETPKGKPTFAEHGGEIFWLNANAKGQVWVNAKQAASAKKAPRAKKTE